MYRDMSPACQDLLLSMIMHFWDSLPDNDWNLVFGELYAQFRSSIDDNV
jgi:hypothetical protein